MEIIKKLDNFLNEAFQTRSLTSHIPREFMSKQMLVTGLRTKMNADIQKLLKPTYFKSIPLGRLFDILEKHGVVPLQEDNTYWSGILAGGVKQTEQVYFNLGWKTLPEKDYKDKGYDPSDKVTYPNKNGQYMAIPNAVLNMTYYKMPQSGNYEIVAYIG